MPATQQPTTPSQALCRKRQGYFIRTLLPTRITQALQKQPLPSDNPYEPFGRYGIIREQFSALTTDLMRALLLEEAILQGASSRVYRH